MGWRCPPLYGNKKSKFYANKIAKAERKIGKQQAIIRACQENLNNVDAKTKN